MKPLLSKEELSELLTPLEPEPGTAAESREQELIIEVGRTLVSSHELNEIHQGSIIVLDKKPGDLLDVYKDNQLVARGKAITIGNKTGIEVTEISGCSTTRKTP
jgi:flagellar motor switch/type III secretory pathway protein FliN